MAKVIDGGFVKPDNPIFTEGLRIVSAKKLGWSMQNSPESTPGKVWRSPRVRSRKHVVSQ
jgi:hypothetical protein